MINMDEYKKNKPAGLFFKNFYVKCGIFKVVSIIIKNTHAAII
jgi:hypothetical protein